MDEDEPTTGDPPGVRPTADKLLARLRERLAGSVTIPIGVDLTAPSGETWDAQEL